MKLIAEGLGSSLSDIGKYEGLFNELDTGELRVYVNEPLSESDMHNLENNIISQGVRLTAPIVQDARIVSIKFQKAIAPLLIIAGSIIAIVGGLLGWQIFKSVQLGVPIWAWLVGGSALLYLLFRKPAKEAAKFYIMKKVGGK